MAIPLSPASADALKGINWCVTKVSKIKLNDAFFKQLGRIATEFRKNPELYTSLGKRIKEVKETKDGLDKILEKVPGGNTSTKASRLAQLIPALIAIGTLGIVLLERHLNNVRFEIQQAANDSFESGLSKSYSLATIAILKARKLERDNKDAKLENQRVRDRVYGLETQLIPIREKSNNALYEVRTGRKILEGSIATARKLGNDALAENSKQTASIAQLRTDFNTYINGVKNGFQQQIQATVNTLKQGLKQANSSIDKANTSISLQSKIIAGLQESIKAIKPASVEDIIVRVKRFFDPELRKILEIESANSSLKINIEGFKLAQSYIDAAQSGQISAIAGSVGNLGNQISQIRNGVVASPNTDLAQAVKVQQTDLNQQKKIVADLGGNLKTFKESVNEHDKKLAQLTGGISDLNQQNNQLKNDLGKLDTKIRDIEKVNADGNKKLDQMIPLVSLIPNIPQNTANTIKPNIPTVPQITQATGTAICNSANGGCLGNALNSNANNINNNTNQKAGDLSNKIRDTNDALQTGILAEILERLGAKLTGGLSGKLVDGFKWLQLDRALNILTFAATVHNAAMLSNDIFQTLVGALTNVLTLILPKDDAGNPFNIGEAIGNSVENVVKGIVGAENYTNLTNAWAKANRIYQATTNVLNSFMSLTQTVLQAAEMIAAYTGKIGNALKKGGVVLENAYGWMNPQPKFNRVTQTLENFQQVASTVQMVTQVPLDVINASTELTTASTEFVKAIKEDTPTNKAPATPEPDAVKAAEAAAKTVSQPNPFDFSDLFDGED